MAFTGAALVLFVTFHCLLNAIAICWPTAYNSVCAFLGANWYALVASVALAALLVIHIIYACVLTMKNRKARGNQAYAISKRPSTVEWSSNNMLVLGIVILAFLVVHLIQFWARMQLQEIRGVEEVLPPAAGTLFLQEAFELPWTAIVYIIGFVALWFHFQHGIWSMFQSVGWDSTVWLPRLKKIACWWATLVCLCFIAQAIVFTIKAHEGFYKTNDELRNQYMTLAVEMYERDFGPAADQIAAMSYDQLSTLIPQNVMPASQFPTEEEFEKQIATLPLDQQSQARKNYTQQKRMNDALSKMNELINYLEGKEGQPQAEIMPMGPQGPQGGPQGQAPQGPPPAQAQPGAAPQNAPQSQGAPQQAPETPETPASPEQPNN